VEKIEIILKSIGGKYSKINAYQFLAFQLFAMAGGILVSVILIKL
jgi:hypothetical protein